MQNSIRAIKLSSLFCVSLFAIACGGGSGGSDLISRDNPDPTPTPGVNTAPTAVGDSSTIAEDSSIEDFDVLANDQDAEGDPLSLVNATADQGNVSIDEEGLLDYTPPSNFNGNVAIDYTITDGEFNANGVWTINVNAVNDPPIAVADEASVFEASSQNLIDVLQNDSDIENEVLTLVSAVAQNGEVSVSGDQLLYTPASGFDGEDTLTYTIADASGAQVSADVSIRVEPFVGFIVALSWEAPTLREDGSAIALDEIDGFEILVTKREDLAFNQRLFTPNNAVSADVFLQDPGNYEFKVAALDNEGYFSDSGELASGALELAE